MITTSGDNSAENSKVETWYSFIDQALSKGGLAAFCIHAIVDDVNNFEGEGGHAISKEQADALFAYTAELGDRVWVATLTEAMLYYFEWSTATVTTEYNDGVLSVSLTDGERDDIYNMPLTVKVSVPGIWNNVTDGENVYEVITAANGTRYILVDVAPETTVNLWGI